jgi:hypothetical protein
VMAIAHTDELKIRPCDLDLCRFQTLLWTKYVCTKFGQNPLKDVDSRVFTRMLRGKKLDPVTKIKQCQKIVQK